MTLNGAMGIILSYFTDIVIFGANYVTVVEVEHTLSAIKM